MKGILIILYSLRLVILFQFSFTAGSPLCWDISASGPSGQKHQQTDNTVGTINLNFNFVLHLKNMFWSEFSWYKFYFPFLGVVVQSF